MPEITPITLPASARRILLVNPTRYLGNLLIAGGLIQDYLAHCQQQNLQCKIVVDQSFAKLLGQALPRDNLILYPRAQIAKGGWQGLRHYFQTLARVRAYHPDVAFNIEEDSVSHRLTQLSGARLRIGCSPQRHRLGYHQVLPIAYSTRPQGQTHRWYSFQEVFAHLGLQAATSPGYLRLNPPPLDTTQQAVLQDLGLGPEEQVVVIHAGATKHYKQWPLQHFQTLVSNLLGRGRKVVLIGGPSDQAICDRISADHQGSPRLINLCQGLDLAALASLLSRQALAMVGNDSGPFHLASALGVPGVVIFGPTEVEIWQPLGEQAQVLQRRDVCTAACSRRHCDRQRQCLSAITPQDVMASLEDLLGSQF